MNDWDYVQIGSICDVGDGAHTKVSRQKIGIPYLTSKNFSKGALKLDDVDFISEDDYENLFSKASKAITRPQKNDVLMSIIGTFGNGYKYKENDFFGISSSIAILRPNQSKIDADFLEYAINSRAFENTHKAYSGGSVQGYSNIPTIKKIPIFLPPLNTQRDIVGILRALDAKIENLRRQNETLEQIAQTLFKHWFIDFEFSNADGKPYKSSGGAMFASELGDIPEGWKVGKLGDYISVKHGYAFKGEYITTEETQQILLTPVNFKIGGGFNDSKYKFYSDEYYPNEYILNKQDLTITMTDLSKEGDTLGYPAFIPEVKEKIFLHNQRIGKVENNKIDKVFLYFLLCRREYRSHILGTSSGSTVRHTSPSRICDFCFAIPDFKLIERFSSIATSTIDKIIINFEEIDTLTKTRDSLLPKLMSGQIRVEV